jgi:hypothetical protein
VREEESTGGGVIKLTTIVTLDGLYGEAELCGHPSEGAWEKYQTSHAREKSMNNAKNHRPPQDSTYSQKY